MADMQQLKVGFVGWLMKYEGPECTTVAACNVDEGARRRFQERHPEVPMFSDFREMLEKADLDLVVVSTPNFTHAEIAVACLEAGKHLFLEKPMGVNRAECDRILAAWQASGKNLGIDFEIRVSPCVRRIKELIDSGEFGELRRIEYAHHQGAWLQNPTCDSWRVDPVKSGGHLLECTIHYMDICRYFAGEVVAVQNTVGPNVMAHYRYPDNLCAHLFFDSGVLAQIAETHTLSATPVYDGQWEDEGEYMRAMGHDMSMIFTLTGGSLMVDFLRPSIMINRIEEWPVGTGATRVIHEKIEDYRNTGYGFYHDSDAMRWEFIRRCATGRPPLQDPRDAWRSHIVCMAADESGEEDGRRVTVDYTEGPKS